MESKKLFVLSYEHNLRQVHRQIIRAPYEELLAAELVVLEEMIKNSRVKDMVDMSLVRLFFGMATDSLLKAKIEQAKTQARAAVFLATFLRYGDKFWAMSKAPAETQKEELKDMYLGLGKIYFDQSLAELLKVQTPCDCLEQAFPALKDKK